MIDATIVLPHQRSANSKKSIIKSIRCSAGGTKIHAPCDAHGNSIAFHLTQGQDHDLKRGEGCVDGSPCEG
ncbi:hypothetical protein P618_200039 [Holospora obtusa F1]|uniref:Transposase DDE domain protein n=1 Tax=Holospora obtusa F1 TaxID=1399147 RepID=W6TVG4_HOLOB|nr:hypothetical protein P618_200039 [Holospora obtusa F1]